MDKIKEIFKMALHPSQWKELFTRYREIIINGIAQHHIVDSGGDICVYHKQDMGISKQGKGLCKKHPSGSVILCGKAVHAVC